MCFFYFLFSSIKFHAVLVDVFQILILLFTSSSTFTFCVIIESKYLNMYHVKSIYLIFFTFLFSLCFSENGYVFINFFSCITSCFLIERSFTFHIEISIVRFLFCFLISCFLCFQWS